MMKLKIKHLFYAAICNAAFVLLAFNCQAQTSFGPVDRTEYQIDFIGNIHVKSSETNGVSSNASEYFARFAPKYILFPGIVTGGVFLEKSKKIGVNENFSYETITGGCWEHLREYFVKAEKSFPIETAPILNLIREIFKTIVH